MTGNVQGKIALVTGGSSGIGRATAIVFARNGAKVVVADINTGEGQETVDMVIKAGGEATFVKTDVSKDQDVQAMIKKAVETYGRLDYAHNNAGILYRGPEANTTGCSEKDWDHLMGINLKGVWLCMKYEIPQMIKQGSGAIVNTSSIAGLVALPDRVGQGLPALVILRVHVGAVGQEQLGHVFVAETGRPVQGSPAVIVLRVHVCAMCQQQPDKSQHRITQMEKAVIPGDGGAQKRQHYGKD